MSIPTTRYDDYVVRLPPCAPRGSPALTVVPGAALGIKDVMLLLMPLVRLLLPPLLMRCPGLLLYVCGCCVVQRLLLHLLLLFLLLLV